MNGKDILNSKEWMVFQASFEAMQSYFDKLRQLADEADLDSM